MSKRINSIYAINGPIIKIQGPTDLAMEETVYVGHVHLVGEVIGVDQQKTTIQVYEDTNGLRPGEPVIGNHEPMSVELGPGILNNIFDGIQRPLEEIQKISGFQIKKGTHVDALNRDKKWEVKPSISEDETVNGGEIIAEIPETKSIVHKVMIPPNVSGKIIEVVDPGKYTIDDTLVKIQKINGEIVEITACQKWPIRKPRTILERLESSRPLITGQRIIDSVFPLAKGGAAAIPGGFGTGKTTMQHQIAKYADADIIIYIGCGERGNEMTEVLEDFSKLIDPRSGASLMERTVLIANTSDMPVAAREASIYTGVTMAEYYRDMGYDVAIMADSTSRWAEALRELSGRLEEMPGEEGFPAYLSSRIAAFYERAGDMENLNHTNGSVSIIGAVSPQGGDFSEPVTQNTKRYVRCFWALDSNLANARHYPAINWINSYSQYIDDLSYWYNNNVDENFIKNHNDMMILLKDEDELNEIVQLIGSDVLPESQKLTLQIAKVIRLGFLQQASFHTIDSAVPIEKQAKMLDVILYLYKRCQTLVSFSFPVSYLTKSDIFNKVINIKYDVPNDKLELFDQYYKEIDTFYDKAMQENG